MLFCLVMEDCHGLLVVVYKVSISLTYNGRVEG